MQAGVVSRDGTPIAVRAWGAGRPLVLVHGSAADHTRWDPLRPWLEPHATLLTMDRRGRGGSGDAAAYALEREVEDVLAVLDDAAARSGGPVDLFGHSFGALCSLEAARSARSLRRLVLYEPSLLAAPEATGFADRAEALLAEGRREAVLELLFRDVLGLSAAELAALRAQPAWAARVAAAHTLPREDRAEAEFRFDPARYAGVRCPALLLLGGESPAFLRASTEAAAKALPGARVAVLEGQQHMAIGAAPGLVAAAVVPFLVG